MELVPLIEALSHAAAYCRPVETVEVRQTHISVVFLAGPFAYKIMKPVDLGFLDFSTVERRHHDCEEEVRLNRRLAPDVYLGVVPVNRAAQGLKVEGPGAAIEWAVKMRRLPEEATLQKRLRPGQVEAPMVRALARKVASFHAQADCGAHISTFGRFEVVARNFRENFDQAAPQVGVTVSRAVFDRLRGLTEDALARLRALIEDLAGRGVPRDTHGDLHLDHVYLFPDRTPPGDLVIVDCIEFNERYRFADPVSDMAFLAMDLAFHGRRDLARAFADGYFAASGDAEGRALLPLYIAYRATVRGKVEESELAEKEVPPAERAAALVKARAHWLLALGEAETPARRPCLILVAGLPGTGKSTLARQLADRANFRLIRSDLVRKELAGLAARDTGHSLFGAGIYTAAWSQRTYAECLARAEKLLSDGDRVVIDASFGAEAQSRAFLEGAARLGVPALLILCQADPDVVRQRLHSRRGDASDADWSVYQAASARWEEVGPGTRERVRSVSTMGTPDRALAQTLGILAEASVVPGNG